MVRVEQVVQVSKQEQQYFGETDASDVMHIHKHNTNW